jgi:dethiobiotin synthetase
LEHICPVRYREPLAPEVAIKRGARPIDFQSVQTYYNRLVADKNAVIVEGIGGLLVPLAEGFTVADLAKQINLPLLIVSRPELGTINHTLLTIEVARSRGLRVAGVVVNSYVADTATVAEETNPAVIERASGTKVLAIVPRDLETNVHKGVVGGGVLFALRQIDYEAIL